MTQPRDIEPLLAQYMESLDEPTDREPLLGAAEHLAEVAEANVAPSQRTALYIFSPEDSLILPDEIQAAIECGCTLRSISVETHQDTTSAQCTVNLTVETAKGIALRSYSVGIDESCDSSGMQIDNHPIKSRQALDTLLCLALTPAARTELQLRDNGQGIPITREILAMIELNLRDQAVEFASQTEYEILAPTNILGEELCDSCVINVSKGRFKHTVVVEFEKSAYHGEDLSLLIGNIVTTHTHGSATTHHELLQMYIDLDTGEVLSSPTITESQAGYEYSTLLLHAVGRYLTAGIDESMHTSYEALTPLDIECAERNLRVDDSYDGIDPDPEDGAFDRL